MKPNLIPLDPVENGMADDVKATENKSEEEEGEEEDYDDYNGEDDWSPPPKDKKTKDKSKKDAPAEGNAEMTAKTSDYSLKRPDSLEALTDDQGLLANPWVKGLDLKTKEWGQLPFLQPGY